MSGSVAQSGAAAAEIAAGLPSRFAAPGGMVAGFSRRNLGGIFRLPVPRNRSTSVHSAHRGGQMDRRNLLKALAGLAACPVCTTTGFAAEGAHWSYEGEGGPGQMGRPRCRQQGLLDRLAAIADRYRSPPSIAAAGAEACVGQDRRHHRQQRPHHSAQFRRGQYAEARRHQLQAAAGAFPPAERTSDRRQEFSDGSAFRPSRGFRRTRRGRRHARGRKAECRLSARSSPPCRPRKARR